MPRQPRQISNSRVYHVMIRGNERKNIFWDDEDRQRFLFILYVKNPEQKFNFIAYCLMDNHVHLLINENNERISKIMQRVNISYAHYFNKKYHRVGHVFQDRFRSEIVKDDRQLLAVVRYIHNNPVKAKLVTTPGEYKWSSFHAYMGKDLGSYQIVNNELVLSLFSIDFKDAQRLFGEFSKQDDNEEYLDMKDNRKIITNEEEARAFIMKSIDGNSTLEYLTNKKLRNRLIGELKQISTLSNRDIAKIMGVDRNIVQRVKGRN